MYKINNDPRLKVRLENVLTYIQISRNSKGEHGVSPALKMLFPLIKFHIVNYHTSFTDCLSNIYICEKHMELPAKQLAYVVCHEIEHILFLHGIRAKDLDIDQFDTWNQATDYFNNSLLETYKDTLETPVLFDEDGNKVQLCIDKKYSHLELGEEEIYKLIYDKNKGKGGGFKSILDQHDNWKKGDTPEEELQANAIKNKINDITNDKDLTIGIGKDDVIIKRLHGLYISKDNDWEKRLRYYLIRNFERKAKYNYHRNSRNNMTEFFLPSIMRLNSPKPRFLFAVDSSGSISDKQLSLFKGEIYRLIKLKAKVDMLACHVNIHNITLDANLKDIENFKPNESGGTEFNPVFDFAMQSKNKYDMIIYLTDGFGYFSPEKYSKFKRNTIWLVNCEGKTKKESEKGANFIKKNYPDFGKVIVIS